MASYLLTGSRGFIGSNLMKHMFNSKKVLDCVGIDNKPNQPAIESYDDNFLYYTLEFDLERINLNKLNDYLISKPKAVIHCASNVGVDLMQRSHIPLTHTLPIDKKVLEFCKKNDLKLVYFSSSEIYGSGSNLSEDSNANIPLSLGNDSTGRANYALEKLFMERMIAFGNLKQGYLIIRPFNIVGPAQASSKGVIPKMIKQILTNKPVKLYKFNGKFSERSYCHIDDFCNILFELQHTYDETGIFNIGNPNNIIDNEALFYKILERMNIKEYKNVEIVDLEYDISNRVPDITKVLSAINCQDYKFKSLDEIIDDTVGYFNAFKYEGL